MGSWAEGVRYLPYGSRCILALSRAAGAGRGSGSAKINAKTPSLAPCAVDDFNHGWWMSNSMILLILPVT